MGGSSAKLSKEESEMLKETESSTRMNRKDLIKEYKNFKTQFPSGVINREQFSGLAESFLSTQQCEDDYVDRLFNAFDNDRSGEIDFSEFMLAMAICSSDKPEDKLKFCFKSLDVDNNGFLDYTEILYAVGLIFQHNPDLKDKVPEEVNSPQKVVNKIFEAVDTDGDEHLTYDELIEFMRTDPQQFTYLGLNLIFLS